MKQILLALLTLFLIGCKTGKSKLTDTNSEQLQFVWDFSKKRKFIYSFSLILTIESKLKKNNPAMKTYTVADGHLNMTAKENNLADLTINHNTAKTIHYDEEGEPKDTIITQKNKKAPTNIAQNINPDGSFDDSNINILVDILLPLPRKPLKKGASDEVPMQVPFRVNDSKLLAKGQNKLTFTGFEEIEGINCAVLKGEIDVSKLDIPEEMKGTYKSTIIGNATYYFNQKDNYYVGADIEIVMAQMIDSETENSDGMFVETTIGNLYTIRLEKIEDLK